MDNRTAAPVTKKEEEVRQLRPDEIRARPMVLNGHVYIVSSHKEFLAEQAAQRKN